MTETTRSSLRNILASDLPLMMIVVWTGATITEEFAPGFFGQVLNLDLLDVAMIVSAGWMLVRRVQSVDEPYRPLRHTWPIALAAFGLTYIGARTLGVAIGLGLSVLAAGVVAVLPWLTSGFREPLE